MCNHKWMTFGADEKGNFRVCSRCGKKVYTITNADRIRAMSDEELAEELVIEIEGLFPSLVYVPMATGNIYISQDKAEKRNAGISTTASRGGKTMISEREKQNREELFHLMQENPDLPVVPMVDGEIAGDDCRYWMASWGASRVDEYLICERAERVAFKSEDDVFDVLEDYLSYEEFEALPENESACRPTYDALPWRKAIIVYIETAEEP